MLQYWCVWKLNADPYPPREQCLQVSSGNQLGDDVLARLVLANAHELHNVGVMESSGGSHTAQPHRQCPTGAEGRQQHEGART